MNFTEVQSYMLLYTGEWGRNAKIVTSSMAGWHQPNALNRFKMIVLNNFVLFTCKPTFWFDKERLEKNASPPDRSE